MNRAQFGPGAWEPLALAWKAYHEGDRDSVIRVHADDGEWEVMPVAVFFRDRDGLRPADRHALALARGRVLDVGAGVGSLSLLLQADGFPVTALEVIPAGVEIMEDRGVRKVLAGRLEELASDQSFDTILLLMNGTSLAGTLNGLGGLLETLRELLAVDGQILMDSTDLGMDGELQYQLEFRGRKGSPFPQLFVAPDTLGKAARERGLRMEVVWAGTGNAEGEYLARLSREPKVGESGR